MTKEILPVKKDQFRSFLKGIKKLSDHSIIKIGETNLEAIASSEDRGMILLARYYSDFDLNTTINIPSVSKLEQALGLTDSADIELTLLNNRLEYRGDDIKFKYHLHEDGVLIPSKISSEKIESFQFDVEFDLNVKFIKDLLKTSGVFKTTNKVYISTDDDNMLSWTLGDEAKSNSDSYSVDYGELEDSVEEIIISLDNLRLIDFIPNAEVTMQINTKIGLACIVIEHENTIFKYIITSLVK